MDGTVAKLCVARVSVVLTRERWGRKQEGKDGGREKNESVKEIDRERADGNSTGRLPRRENTVTKVSKTGGRARDFTMPSSTIRSAVQNRCALPFGYVWDLYSSGDLGGVGDRD